MDYRALLKEYMKTIMASEGIDYINAMDQTTPDIEELKKLSQEIQDEGL